MSKRLTPRWTESLEDAYGSEGKKGFAGEAWLAEILTKKGYEVTLHNDDKQKQLQGIDITVSGLDLRTSITIDVKANIKQDGTFFVETDEHGWLKNPRKTSNLIWHVNPNTGHMVRYSRKKMKEALTNLNSNNLLKLNIETVQSLFEFVKLSKIDQGSH